MALAERTEPTPSTAGLPCSIGTVYAKLEADVAETEALNQILYGTGPDTRGKSQQQVWLDLDAEGFTVGAQSINRHRATTCRCFREQPSRFCGTCKRDLPHCVCESA